MTGRYLSLIKFISSTSWFNTANLPYGYLNLGSESRAAPVVSSLARYTLSENKARVSLIPQNTPGPVLTSPASQTTFLYQKIPPVSIPRGYSNDRLDLQVIDHNLEKYYGSAFQDAKPLLVKIDDGMVAWHVLEAEGQYYMRHGRLGYLRHVDGPASWASLGKEDPLETRWCIAKMVLFSAGRIRGQEMMRCG